MKNDKIEILQKNRSVEQFYDTTSVESSTGMTGLTPTPPLTEEDAESYSEINGIPVPGDPPKKKKKNEKKERPPEPDIH